MARPGAGRWAHVTRRRAGWLPGAGQMNAAREYPEHALAHTGTQHPAAAAARPRQRRPAWWPRCRPAASRL